jgi:aspartate kinase
VLRSAQSGEIRSKLAGLRSEILALKLKKQRDVAPFEFRSASSGETCFEENRKVNDCPTRKIVVIKLGGSVLADAEAFRRAARFLVRRLHTCSQERFLVVVSAEKGLTDELASLGRGITEYPNPRTLDLLWSIGELRSVALLTLHLEDLGVSAVGLNVHEAGLRSHGSSRAEPRVEALSTELHRAFDDYSIVVVPGFFATLANGTLVSLGRGGSDLSAVLLAEGLEAEHCELIKDVNGYFTKDPNIHTHAQHLPSLSYEQALEMASSGCELVQPRAIEAARVRGLRVVVRSLDDTAPGTILSAQANQQRGCVIENKLAESDFSKN